jgi:hypothetical protein
LRNKKIAELYGPGRFVLEIWKADKEVRWDNEVLKNSPTTMIFLNSYLYLFQGNLYDEDISFNKIYIKLYCKLSYVFLSYRYTLRIATERVKN